MRLCRIPQTAEQKVWKSATQSRGRWRQVSASPIGLLAQADKNRKNRRESLRVPHACYWNRLTDSYRADPNLRYLCRRTRFDSQLRALAPTSISTIAPTHMGKNCQIGRW
jgi:hypothetical protein